MIDISIWYMIIEVIVVRVNVICKIKIWVYINLK